VHGALLPIGVKISTILETAAFRVNATPTLPYGEPCRFLQ